MTFSIRNCESVARTSAWACISRADGERGYGLVDFLHGWREHLVRRKSRDVSSKCVSGEQRSKIPFRVELAMTQRGNTVEIVLRCVRYDEGGDLDDSCKLVGDGQ
jgi:hypothetical protein